MSGASGSPGRGPVLACHKPVCATCVVSTAEGKFCSHECADRTADFRTRYRKTEARGSGLGDVVKFVIWLVILLLALCVVNRYFYRIPVIGDYLWKASATTP